MKKKIVITANSELQRKQFKIPENLNRNLQNYSEKIDSTENSIINQLLEDFFVEIEFGTMIYNMARYDKTLLISAPIEELGFNAEGNNLTLQKRLKIDAIKTDPNRLSYKYSFKGEMHTRIAEHDAYFSIVKTETTSLLGLFNTFEELLEYFKIDHTWTYQMNLNREQFE
ncbi:MAG: hypothetical protein ACRC6U_01990 [Fusobacteriaceae bacterium]